MLKREAPRVAVEQLCSEVVADREHFGMIVDLSQSGLRLQRPLRRSEGRIVQLEFELPDADEIVWAKGEICFDQLWRVAPPTGGAPRPVRTSGVRLVAAATRHLRMLRDWVMAAAEANAVHERGWLLAASHWD